MERRSVYWNRVLVKPEAGTLTDILSHDIWTPHGEDLFYFLNILYAMSGVISLQTQSSIRKYPHDSAWLALCAGNSPVPVNSPHKGQWRGALMFSLICLWTWGWWFEMLPRPLWRHCNDLRQQLRYCPRILLIVTHLNICFQITTHNINYTIEQKKVCEL